MEQQISQNQLQQLEEPKNWDSILRTAHSRKDAVQAVKEVEDWRAVRAETIVKMITWAIPLPGPFYQQLGSYGLRAVAEQMQHSCEDLTAVVLGWSKCDHHKSSLLRLQFLFDMTTSAILKQTWQDEECCQALYRLYESVSKDYMMWIYNPELLKQDEDWIALPLSHQVALHLMYGRAALDQGDETAYIHQLHEIIQVCPLLKGMAEYLLEHIPEPGAMQMDALTRQIYAILAAYDPNDPALKDLKATAAYQKMAGFLESTSPPVFGGLLQ